jgi:two-component system, cell cycle sensor histidine kinase and response regulator CckA
MSAVASPFEWPLETREGALRNIFEHAPVGLARCTRLGTVTAMNPALECMIGKVLSSSEPLCFFDLFQDEDREQGKQLFENLIIGERTNFELEKRAPGPAGTAAWIRWTAWRVGGGDGAFDFALLMAEDTTESQRIEQRLVQAERLQAVGRLASGVAHDFNNLLTGLILCCDLLLAGLEPGNRLRKYAEEIRGAGLQAAAVVKQLLSVARPRNTGSRPLSLNQITQAMQQLLLHLVGANIDLDYRLDPDLGLVKMDPTQAQEILLNLVLNARDAMPNGGRITVETSNCEVQVLTRNGTSGDGAALLPCVLFAVSDSGIGMDAETRKHLFEVFFTTKPAGKGNGLGLATVYDIVTGSGGLIYVDSEPGSGTRVSILLPLAPEAAFYCLHTSDSPPENTETSLSNPEKEVTQ